MLSVLIPTFNYDCSKLVYDLCQKGAELDNAFEVIVADDASTDSAIVETLKKLEDVNNVRFFRCEHNLGRAAVRNFLAEQALGEWLLFIDSDAEVPRDFSLKRYLEATDKADVVCGGLRHPEANPNPDGTLRYKYEIKADLKRGAEVRNLNPYEQLSTFSLLINKGVFSTIRFDEQCREYGYEDTLLGIELQNRGISLLHIDNPLIHIGIESNEVFLNKTKNALRTLKRIQPMMNSHSKLLRTVQRLKQWHLLGVVKCLYAVFKRLLRRNLLSRHPSLNAFAFYKLGFFLFLKPHF